MHNAYTQLSTKFHRPNYHSSQDHNDFPFNFHEIGDLNFNWTLVKHIYTWYFYHIIFTDFAWPLPFEFAALSFLSNGERGEGYAKSVFLKFWGFAFRRNYFCVLIDWFAAAAAAPLRIGFIFHSLPNTLPIATPPLPTPPRLLLLPPYRPCPHSCNLTNFVNESRKIAKCAINMSRLRRLLQLQPACLPGLVWSGLARSGLARSGGRQAGRGLGLGIDQVQLAMHWFQFRCAFWLLTDCMTEWLADCAIDWRDVQASQDFCLPSRTHTHSHTHPWQEASTTITANVSPSRSHRYLHLFGFKAGQPVGPSCARPAGGAVI